MSTASFPVVRLAAVAITRGDQFLSVFNAKWGAFTLPMSKRRSWNDPEVPGSNRDEEPRSAAIRAAAEALRRPLGPDERPYLLDLLEVQPFQQSDRDGIWKTYRFEVFRLDLKPGESLDLPCGAASAWMTLDAMRESRPVSPTAVRLAESIRGTALLRGEA